MTTELHKIIIDADPLRGGMTYLQVQVDDTLALRLYADFTLLIIDDQSATKPSTEGTDFTYEPRNPGAVEPGTVSGFEVPIDQFRRSFEALMAESVARYGAKP